MAFTKVQVLRRDSSRDSSGPVETWTYLVITDSPATTYPVDAETATDGTTAVAAYLSSHPTKASLKATRITADYFEEARGKFKVLVTFSVPVWGFDETRPEGPAIKWNKRVSVTGVESIETTNRDVDNKPIRNSAGDKFPADIPNPFYDELITVEFDTDYISPAVYRLARGKINSDSVTLTVTKDGATYSDTFGESTLKCGNISYDITIGSDGISAWHVAIPMMHRSLLDVNNNPKGWYRELADKGHRWKSDAGVLQPYSPAVQYLDGSGKLLAPDTEIHLIWANLILATPFSAFLSGV